jgi:predicted helicase
VRLKPAAAQEAKALALEWASRLPRLERLRSFLDSQAENFTVTPEAAADFMALFLMTLPITHTFLEPAPWRILDPAHRLAIETGGDADTPELPAGYQAWAAFRAEAYPGHQSPELRWNWYSASLQEVLSICEPSTVKTSGVVFTPYEVVKFIVLSVAGVLEKEFGRPLAGGEVFALDPFAGHGVFQAAALAEGLLDDNLEHKYRTELLMREINPFFWYLARQNIAREYLLRGGRGALCPICPGVRLTDTFQQYEDAK